MSSTPEERRSYYQRNKARVLEQQREYKRRRRSPTTRVGRDKERSLDQRTYGKQVAPAEIDHRLSAAVLQFLSAARTVQSLADMGGMQADTYQLAEQHARTVYERLGLMKD